MCLGASGCEAGSVQALDGPVWQGEADGAVMELLHVATATLVGLDTLHAHDVYGGCTGTVTCSHVAV